MGFDDAMNKAKGAYDQNEDKIKEQAGQHGDKVDGAIDNASQRAQDIAPDQADGAIDNAANKGKEGFDNWSGGQQ